MKGRLTRFFKWALSALLVLTALLLVSVILVLRTETGTRLLMDQLADQINQRPGLALSYGSVSGSLLHGLTLREVSVELAVEDGGSTRVLLARGALGWQPLALLQRRLRIGTLALAGLRIDVAPAPQQPEQAPPDVAAILEDVFDLPLSFRMADLTVDDLLLDLPDTEVAVQRIEASLWLDDREARVEDFLWRAPDYALQGRLRLGAGEYELDGWLAWELVQAVAGEVPHGGADIAGTLQTVELEHRLRHPAALQSSGTVWPGVLDGAEPRFELEHRIEEVDGATLGLAALTNARGRLETVGTVDAVNLQGEAEVAWQDLPPFALNLQAEYDEDAVSLHQMDLRSELLALSISGDARLDPLAASIDWRLERLDTGNYLTAVSLEAVNGAGTVDLHAGEAAPVVGLRLASLSGRLNGHDLDVSGQASLRESAVEGLQLRLAAGDNNLALRGRLVPGDSAADLEWSIDAPALQALLPALSGRLHGSGSLAGSLEAPRLAGELQGSDLAWRAGEQTYSLARLSLQAFYQGRDNTLTLALEDARLPVADGDYRVRGLELNASGTPEAHTLRLSLDSPRADLRVAAEGGWRDAHWRGALEQANIRSDFGDWVLQGSPRLEAGGEVASLQRHCWRFQQVRLCGGGDWSAEQGYSATFELTDFPLGFLNPPEALAWADEPELQAVASAKPGGLQDLQDRFNAVPPEGSYVGGTLNLSGSLHGAPQGGLPALDVQVRPEDLRLGLLVEAQAEELAGELAPQSAVSLFRFRDVALDLHRDSDAWRGDAAFGVFHQEASGLDLQGRFSGQASLRDDGGLAGGLNVDVGDLAWVEALAPMMRNTAGRLAVRAELGGRLSQPELTGGLELQDGSLEIPAQGLHIQDLNLAVRSDSREEVRISGGAVSGGGRLQLTSTLHTPFDPDRRLELRLEGEDFLVMSVPGIEAAASPDVAVRFDSQGLNVSGDVLLPRLDVDLAAAEIEVTGGGVGVSRDAVVVNVPPEQQERLRRDGGEQVLRRIPVTGDITIALGNDVRFSGYGLDLTLGGRVSVEQTPNRPILVYGEVNVQDGVYEMYGQELNAEGKLIFLGNPANPALDMQAYREVRDTLVGVQMSGTLRNIRGQLYSSPALPESEILAMLVTGKSFNNVGGQDSNALLSAIATLGIDRGQGITNAVQNRLGLDTLEVTSGEDISDSALGLGKYITPDLFMRYEVGLFDNESHLTLNYSLTDRIKLEVESGVSQSVDLTYTVEK